MSELDNDNLTSKEKYDLKKKEKQQSKNVDKVKEKVSGAPKKVGKFILYTLVTVVVVGGLGLLASLAQSLPPTSQENHVEDSPPAHILTERIPDAIQRHMLEHADGRGAPGILIQYNCDDYECEENLVQKLTTLVEEYPDNVYLAPNKYDGKIIMTRLNKREILDEFDEQAIRDFIQ